MMKKSKKKFQFKGTTTSRCMERHPKCNTIRFKMLANNFQFFTILGRRRLSLSKCVHTKWVRNQFKLQTKMVQYRYWAKVSISLDIEPSEKMSVIFFIHGGGYMSGGSSWHGPDLLLDEDIVLVTINYRLGPFGFLSLNTAEYSGNMGLKDQLLALKWVNENIEHFGGKPFYE